MQAAASRRAKSPQPHWAGSLTRQRGAETGKNKRSKKRATKMQKVGKRGGRGGGGAKGIKRGRGGEASSVSAEVLPMPAQSRVVSAARRRGASRGQIFSNLFGSSFLCPWGPKRAYMAQKTLLGTKVVRVYAPNFGVHLLPKVVAKERGGRRSEPWGRHEP